MNNKEAHKRYFKVFVPSMAGYLVSIVGATWLTNMTDTVSLLHFILALIPAGFVFMFMWAQARYVVEIDEFMRMLQVKAMMWGIIITMAATTAWGLLEFFTPVPKVPIFFVLPVFYGIYGVTSGVLRRQYNASCKP